MSFKLPSHHPAAEGGSGTGGEIAEGSEQAGLSHLAFGDTWNIGPEAWGQLLLAAGASTRIRLGTGGTSPVTRDLGGDGFVCARLASREWGRAICSIGRGESALAKIGRRPERVAIAAAGRNEAWPFGEHGVVDFDRTESDPIWIDEAGICRGGGSAPCAPTLWQRFIGSEPPPGKA